MNHLTIDEIVDFVSLKKLDDHAKELSVAVNSHIRSCEQCRRLVNAFQTLYDEFLRLHQSGEFKGRIKEKLSAEAAPDAQAVLQQLEDYR